MFVVFNALIALSVFVFRFGMNLSFVDAVYFLITTVTTVGYGDYNLRESGPALKLYGALVMLLGSATIATLYSILTDFVVSTRFEQLGGRRRLPDGEPIVVDGQVVGAIGVSGASSAARDATIALAGAAALNGKTSAAK